MSLRFQNTSVKPRLPPAALTAHLGTGCHAMATDAIALEQARDVVARRLVAPGEAVLVGVRC
eukprot:4554853-Prorocentrum_lima.AAC.1